MACRRALRLVGKAAPPFRRAILGAPARSAEQAAVLIELRGANGSVRPFSAFSGLERNALQSLRRGEDASGRFAFKYDRTRPFTAAADLPTHEEIGMPSLSPTMTQGNIAKWHKQIGDEVTAGDVLCEIETDKATLEMESMEDGFVAKILHEDGAKDLPVGTPICIMVESKDDIEKFADYTGGEAPAPPPKKEEESAEPPPAPPPTESKPEPEKTEGPKPAAPSPPPEGRIFASPAAKKLAEEKKIDLASVKGSGPDGRIVKADIEDFVAKGPVEAKAEAKPDAKDAAPPPKTGATYTDIPNSQIRKVTAKRLQLSKSTVPHFYLTIDCNVDKLVALRAELNAIQEKANGKKLSLNDFVVKAAALALRKVPECNSSWFDEFIRRYHNVDVTIAVQTERGLMVPIIKDADKKGLATISEDVKRLADKAREGKLKPDEYEGGTFTVSNLGMYGIKSFSAIINPPQSCILAVGATEKRVVPGLIAGEYASANYMAFTLSCDHRCVDGAVGAQYMGAFKSIIEDPMTFLL